MNKSESAVRIVHLPTGMHCLASSVTIVSDLNKLFFAYFVFSST